MVPAPLAAPAAPVARQPQSATVVEPPRVAGGPKVAAQGVVAPVDLGSIDLGPSFADRVGTLEWAAAAGQDTGKLSADLWHEVESRYAAAARPFVPQLAAEMKAALGAPDRGARFAAAMAKTVPDALASLDPGLVDDAMRLNAATARINTRATALPANDPLVVKAQALLDKLAPGQFKAVVLPDARVNAENGGGREVYINQGFLEQLGEDEQAGLLGHELAHFQHHDVASAVLGKQLLDAASAQLPPDANLGADLQRAAVAPRQAQELAADADGLRTASRAGFDVQAVVALDRQMAAQEPAATDWSLVDHPDPASRADRMEAQIAREHLGR